MSKCASARLLLAAAVAGCVSAQANAQEIQLDGIVVTASKTEESWIEALSGSSVVERETLDQQFNADRVSEILRTIPGVATQETARDTATAINIRGLQDFGRVNVLIDGARQNFQRTGHAANGVFYIEPEMIKRVDITRGPTATIYGSGAIGGVAAFETLDADDILRPGEYAAVRSRTSYGANGNEKLASGTTAVKVGNFDILGQFNGRWNDDYDDGSGNRVPGSNDETRSKLVKMRVRPAEGHQITASLIDFNSAFIDEVESTGNASQYDTEVDNRQYTLGYTFQSPTNPLIDFSSKVYYNETSLGQERLVGGDATYFSPNPGPGGFPCPFATVGPCFMFPGAFPVGAVRSFNTETAGIDVWNTSRFDLTSGIKAALTYGGDAFRDTVKTVDPVSGGEEFTPSGERTLYGGFVQSRLTFFDVVDVVGALRYDNYELDGGGFNVEDDRVSPKLTVGVTPVQGVTVFGTWAEGFRAPHLSETLISGFHPGFAHFQLRPNPDLAPEVAETVEGGVNLKFDNVLKGGDTFRAKFTAFRNEVANYIDQVFVEGPIDGIVVIGPPPGFLPVFIDDYVQYRNIRNATIEGLEFEAFYDAQSWFAGIGAHRIRGKNEDDGTGLRTVPADQVTLTAGFRALDERLVAGGRVRFVAGQDRFTEGNITAQRHTDAHTVVDLFAQYEATDNLTVNLNIDNLFDETYRQHLDPHNSAGFSARAGLTMRFGASN